MMSRRLSSDANLAANATTCPNGAATFGASCDEGCTSACNTHCDKHGERRICDHSCDADCNEGCDEISCGAAPEEEIACACRINEQCAPEPECDTAWSHIPYY